MRLFLHWLTVVFILIQKISLLEALSGSVVLDSITFEKIIAKFRTVLVKFDIEYPYGQKHEEFEKVVKSVKNNDILFAEVGVQQFGDKQNMDLMEKYGIKIEDIPVCKLFINGDLKNAIHFSDEFKSDSILRFLRKHSSIRISLNQDLEEFDELAERFMKSTEEERNDIINETKQRVNQLSNEDNKNLSENYIKIMEKIVKNGNHFIESENQRLNAILSQKLTQNKKNEIKSKIDILFSFSINQNLIKENLKNEL